MDGYMKQGSGLTSFLMPYRNKAAQQLRDRLLDPPMAADVPGGHASVGESLHIETQVPVNRASQQRIQGVQYQSL